MLEASDILDPQQTKMRARASILDRALYTLFVGLFAISCLIVFAVGYVLLLGAWPAFQSIHPLRFLTDSDWHPTVDLYNMKPMIVGSLLTSFGAVVIAAPISLIVAIAINFFVSELAATIFRRLLLVLAAIPTVIFGVWGLNEIVPFIGKLNPPGMSLLSGIIILSLMILPTTSLLIDMALRKIPRTLLNGAFALGASRNLTCFYMTLPVIFPAVISAALLGLGRALGETIVVVMVTGNRAEMPSSIFDPIRTLTANVALEIGYASPLHSAALFFSILLLFVAATALALMVSTLDKTVRAKVDT